MGMESLKTLSDELRSLSEGKSRVHWPADFKSRVIKELSDGASVGDVSRATGIGYSTIMNWKSSRKSRNNNFKPVHVKSSSTPDSLTLSLPAGSEITGLLFSDLCELLKRGLI